MFSIQGENHGVSMMCSQLGGDTLIQWLEWWVRMEFHEPGRSAIQQHNNELSPKVRPTTGVCFQL